MKIAWGMITKKEKLWVKVLREKYKIGEDGKDTFFWTDHWIPGINNLSALAVGPIPQEELRKKFVTIPLLKTIGIGACSISCSLRSMLQDGAQGSDSDMWKKLWRCPVPERVKFFLWTLSHDSVMTNNQRKRRSFCNSDICPICNNAIESALHAVRDCGHVKEYWLNLIPSNWKHDFFDMDLQDWIHSNISNKSEWNTRFALSVWSIWKQRNEIIFKNKARSLVSIKMMTDRYMEGITKAGLINSSNDLNPQPEKEFIRWNPPDENWSKMNVDGSCCPVLAEAWAVKIDLELARNSGVQNLVLEADSLIVINMIKNGVEIDHPLFPIIAGIRDMADKADWNVTFSHTLREGNRVANVLASLAHSCPIYMQVWSNPPCMCVNALQDDVRGA
ncbi:uncharacterized protein G2W53_015643 [Senna tora]|uniref:Uncharacterized protein n=1 Tax=Senna tora TaxID=362788 RepID=A0A835C834_9FABA|nr:uncharacterized protein G2W53_015643 [Senna tora]